MDESASRERRPPAAAPRPNISDVARRAGVAIGTVSNTLNNPQKVSPETRERVEQAISELGFIRNDAARSLAAGTSTSVGLVVADLGNSLFVDIARGAESTLHRHGMNLLIADSAVDLERQRSNMKTFERARVAGILLAPLDTGELEPPSTLTTGTPVVLVNYESRRQAYSGVVADEGLGGYLAARHLLDLGLRSLLFVGGPLVLRAVADRFAGSQRAVAEVPGATIRLVETHGLNIKHGRSAAQRIIAGTERIDGVVAASDLLAIGLIQLFDDTPGFRVPLDIGVVGYDNNHFASESRIPVTTISQPGARMGEAAAALLLDRINGDAADTVETVVLEPHLIPRQSTLGTRIEHH